MGHQHRMWATVRNGLAEVWVASTPTEIRKLISEWKADAKELGDPAYIKLVKDAEEILTSKPSPTSAKKSVLAELEDVKNAFAKYSAAIKNGVDGTRKTANIAVAEALKKYASENTELNDRLLELSKVINQIHLFLSKGQAAGVLTERELMHMHKRLVKGTKIVLQRNATYTTNTNGHTTTYVTDEYGRLETIKFDITGVRSGPRHADKNVTAAIGRLSGRLNYPNDIGFHIVGDQFNGAGYYPNLVPGDGKLNGSSGGLNDSGYYMVESAWRKAYENSKAVKAVEVQLVYEDDKAAIRPKEFVLTFRVANQVFDVAFDNSSKSLDKTTLEIIERIQKFVAD